MNFFDNKNNPSNRLDAIISQFKLNPTRNRVVPEGEYVARLSEWRTGTNRNDNLQTELIFTVCEGEYAGAEVRFFIYWTDAASPRSWRICQESLGIDPSKRAEEYEPIFVRIVTNTRHGSLGVSFAEIIEMQRLTDYTPPQVELPPQAEPLPQPPAAPEVSDHAPGVPGAL